MIYPKNLEKKIDFDKIRDIIIDNCFGDLGKKKAKNISFSSDFNFIQDELNLVDEIKQLISIKHLPLSEYFDITGEIKRISTKGTFIDTDNLHKLCLSLNILIETFNFISEAKEYQSIQTLIKTKGCEKLILGKINNIIDEKGRIKDNASSELKKIRLTIISKRHSLEKRVNYYLNLTKKEGWSNADDLPTIRNGRAVIPVNSSNKKKLKGIVQDESASGNTVFLEPDEIVEINNEIKELEYAEKREIQKILLELTDFIRPYCNDIVEAFNQLGNIDFIHSKARFAIKTNSIKPLLTDESIINWQAARHPYLELSLNKQDKKIIANDFRLNSTDRILVISGPNAGGKSVCIKTVALIQYMLQCGFLIPVSENSYHTGIFNNLFLEIGDEQSIENDLSTYSSHLLSIKHFINYSDNRTLLFIDEFGSGTEPSLGAAIAEAALEELKERGALGIVTTHYTNLKLLAGKKNGILNGAMSFDKEKLIPTYFLKTGTPGSSYAFQIARKIGFQKSILKNAEKKLNIKHIDFEKQLDDLSLRKKEYDLKKNQVEAADEILAEVIKKYTKLYNDLQKSSKTIIEDAKKTASQIIADSNKIIEHTVKEIKETQADKENTKSLREKIKNFEKQIKDIKDPIAINKSIKQTIQFKINQENIIPIFKKGDKVIMKGQTQVGKILDIYETFAIVAFDKYKIKLPVSELDKTEKKEKIVTEKKSFSTNDINEKTKNFHYSIDLRGKRADEALIIVQKHIDDALLINIKEIKILHGKGSGILRQVIRDYLKKLSYVKSFNDEEPEKGGDGITLVTFI
ncbi:MAG: Smr/MutS family protein [Bacteroidales bacterium]|nr:Smr/MutS family protein [Bacteroidales bacterium]